MIQPPSITPIESKPRPVGVAEAALLLVVWFYAPVLAQHGWDLIQSVAELAGMQLGAPIYGAPGSVTAQWWSGAFWIGLSFALVIYITKIRRLKPEALGLVPPNLSRDGPITLTLALVAGGAFALILIALIIAATVMPGAFGGEPGDSSLKLLFANFGHPAAPASIVFYVVIVAPVIEELWFRGLLQTSLRETFGPKLGIVATALVFAFAHTSSGPPVSQLIGGLVFGFAFERTKGLTSPILLHMLGNGTYVALSLWGWSAAR